MTKLDDALNKTSICHSTRRQIIDALWPTNTSLWSSHDVLDLEPFFRYYTRQCHFALIDRGQHVLARTHQDIVDVVRQVEDAVPRETIKESLRSKLLKRERPDEDDILEGTIDLAARIHVMINISSAGASFSQPIQLKWRTGPLKPLLTEHFEDAQILGNDGIQLEPTFTAANLELIAGIKVQPTDNLADHLRMIDIEDKVVAVFHHASFLKRNTSTLLPDGLREETLRTLALLFPKNDRPTHKWLKKQTTRFDGTIQSCGALRLDERQIERFHFWHDRVIMLKQAFDQSRPATISQWWFDRRNGVQWYTFWVAIWVLFLTIFFGMVQSIEGALQVYQAYHPS